jgi:hypothetical protein
MKQVLLVILALGLTLMLFGCSQSPTSTNTAIDVPDAALVQRPDFVDTRTDAEKLAATLKPTTNYRRSPRNHLRMTAEIRSIPTPTPPTSTLTWLAFRIMKAPPTTSTIAMTMPAK